MARRSVTGEYAVPAEIMRLKPREICCTVKVMKVPSKKGGSNLHYYVYELINQPNWKLP